MKSLRIVFMGTPEFAVPSLEILADNGFNIVGVITAPDKPKGRGQQLSISPVKEAAENRGLKVLQPTNLKDPGFIEELELLQVNLQVVVAFRMLPEIVWSMPEFGTFNLHASLLPQYRGAAPINWAIINGEKETGVTTFFLKHEIDTGDILFQEKEVITESDDAGSLYLRLMEKGSVLVLKTVEAISRGEIQTGKQSNEGQHKTAPKIFKDTCEINWNQTTEKIYNFIRGLSPYPSAWTQFNNSTYKIGKTQVVDHDYSAAPGEVVSDNRNYLYVKTADGWISILELQKQGKRKMGIEEFLRGNQL